MLHPQKMKIKSDLFCKKQRVQGTPSLLRPLAQAPSLVERCDEEKTVDNERQRVHRLSLFSLLKEETRKEETSLLSLKWGDGFMRWLWKNVGRRECLGHDRPIVFARFRREWVIDGHHMGRTNPPPWTNIIANSSFCFNPCRYNGDCRSILNNKIFSIIYCSRRYFSSYDNNGFFNSIICGNKWFITK